MIYCYFLEKVMKLSNLFEDVIDATDKFNKRRGDHNIQKIVDAEMEFVGAIQKQDQAEQYFKDSVKALKQKLMKETQKYRLMLAPVYKYFPKDSNILFVLTQTFEDPIKLSPQDHSVAIKFLKDNFNDLSLLVESIIEELDTLEVVLGELPIPYPKTVLEHSGLEMFKKGLVLSMDFLEKTLRGFKSKRSVNESSEKKTLYVSRPVLNKDELIKWAKSQGFKNIMDPDDFHVTICFSKEKVDWNSQAPKTNKLIVKTSDRSIKKFGEAVVLCFNSQKLHDRFEEFMDMGCSFDHDSYQPHITIVYDAEINPETIEPYMGSLVFGGEKWDLVQENWKDGIENEKI